MHFDAKYTYKQAFLSLRFTVHDIGKQYTIVYDSDDLHTDDIFYENFKSILTNRGIAIVDMWYPP